MKICRIFPNHCFWWKSVIKKKYLKKIKNARPTDPTWKVRPPVKQGIFSAALRPNKIECLSHVPTRVWFSLRVSDGQNVELEFYFIYLFFKLNWWKYTRIASKNHLFNFKKLKYPLMKLESTSHSRYYRPTYTWRNLLKTLRMTTQISTCRTK